MKILMAVLTLVVLVGCSKTEDSDRQKKRNRDMSLPEALVNGSPADHPAADKILISVNGKDLLLGEALRQVQLRLGGPPPPDMPMARIENIQRQVLSKVIDEFVKRELLLKEADRLEIEAPEDEIEKTLAGIRERSPEGQEPQGILTEGPAGDDTLRNEVVTAIRIEKLLAKALPPVSEPTADEIAAFRSEHGDQLTLPERVRAHHILVKVDENATDDQKSSAKVKADTLHSQLLEGADFERLAKAESSCPSSVRGGDLGVFPRGKMADAFEAAAFSQTPGEIGPVIETPFGYHIIRVDEHLDAGPVDDKQVVGVLKQRARAKAMSDYVRGLQRNADIKYSSTVKPPAPLSTAESDEK